MTDTTTLDETPDSDDELPELVDERVAGRPTAPAEDTPLKARVLAAVPRAAARPSPSSRVLVLNISRVFLAGDEDAALVMAIVITLDDPRAARRSIAAAPRLQDVVAGDDPRGSCSSWCRGGPRRRSGPASTTARAATAPATCSPPARPTSHGDVEAAGVDQVQRHRHSPRTAGIVQINYSGATGHTLAIQDPKFDGFLLSTDAGGPKIGQGRADARASTRSTAPCRPRSAGHEGDDHRHRMQRPPMRRPRPRPGGARPRAVAAVVFAACGGGGGGGSSAAATRSRRARRPQTIAIEAGNFFFKPDTVDAPRRASTRSSSPATSGHPRPRVRRRLSRASSSRPTAAATRSR